MKPHCIQVLDGEPHRYWLRKSGKAVVGTICCDCRLVHTMIFTPRKHYILVRAWRNAKLTKTIRKKK